VLGSAVVRADDNKTGHYVNGVEGIKGASLPPPGKYLRVYSALYTAGKLTDQDGDSINAVPNPQGPEEPPIPVDFDVTVFALVPRFIWISDMEVLGGNLGADALIQLIYTDVELDPVMSDDQFSMGDLYVEPCVVAWHGPRYDAAAGLSAYIPIGDYKSSDPASPGKDFWTGMLTAGATLYLDAERTWSASILARYETHSEKDGSDVTLGDDFHFEWGVGKTLQKTWDVGVSGYCHWQVSDDCGDDVDADATWDKDVHDSVLAVGPEVVGFCPKTKAFVSLRSLWEFNAEDRPEGNITCLTVTKIL